MSLQEEPCPIDLEMLGTIYRSSCHGLDALIATVPPETRAMLALYCYRRGHLSSIGLAIAASCEEHELINAGGRAGSTLFEMARERPEEQSFDRPARKKVTLASGMLRDVSLFRDQDPGEIQQAV